MLGIRCSDENLLAGRRCRPGSGGKGEGPSREVWAGRRRRWVVQPRMQEHCSAGLGWTLKRAHVRGSKKGGGGDAPHCRCRCRASQACSARGGLAGRCGWRGVGTRAQRLLLPAAVCPCPHLPQHGCQPLGELRSEFPPCPDYLAGLAVTHLIRMGLPAGGRGEGGTVRRGFGQCACHRVMAHAPPITHSIGHDRTGYPPTFCTVRYTQCYRELLARASLCANCAGCTRHRSCSCRLCPLQLTPRRFR